MSTVTIQIPDYLKRHVDDLIKREGLTMDQFFTSAASEKIAAIEAVDYISARAARADEGAFQRAISKIPATPVTEDWDAIPNTNCAEGKKG